MLSGDQNQAALLKDKKIRIITISQIRYEGILYQINTKDKTIALKNVVAFGSEDRREDQVIPPSQAIYELIIFKASHIKDINVLSQEEEFTTQAARPGPSGEGQPKEENMRGAEELESKEYKDEALQGLPQPRHNNRRHRDDEEDDYVPKSTNNGQGGSNDRDEHRPYNQNYRKEQSGKKDHQRKDRGLKDFDYDEMVEKNNILEKQKEVKDEQKEEPPKYDQNNFFDNLSTSVNDRQEQNKKDPYHLYKTNNETFGYQKRNHNHGRGGRGRGGRGGYDKDRDYHRREGGYNNRRDNYNRDYRDNRDHRDNRDNNRDNYRGRGGDRDGYRENYRGNRDRDSGYGYRSSRGGRGGSNYDNGDSYHRKN